MENDKPLVVGINGSIRTRESDFGVDSRKTTKRMLDGIRQLEDREIYDEDFLSQIQPYLRDLTEEGDRNVTNSESLVLTSLYGAKKRADIEYHKLADYVGVDRSYAEIEEDKIKPLLDIVQRADGLVLGSPVYFGDRSSLMHSFINFCSRRNLLEGKVISTVSVGSKRNGGQETTNVYALFENLTHGAYIVGNGPKTCQYGGTGWGGDIGDVVSDEFGLETSMGTGIRVSQVANVLKSARGTTVANPETEEPLDIGIIVTKELDDIVKTSIQNDLAAIEFDGVEFEVVDMTEEYIQACIACDVCPTPRKVEDVTGNGQDYKCIIDDDIDAERFSDDTLQNAHEHLVGHDALIIASMDVEDETNAVDVYQALLERTRYLRRDDWRLHNTPLCTYLVKDAHVNSIIPMKVMSSWMRHNTIVNPPIEKIRYPDGVSPDTNRSAEKLAAFIDNAKQIRKGRQLAGKSQLSYKATGYEQKVLDTTSVERT